VRAGRSADFARIGQEPIVVNLEPAESAQQALTDHLHGIT
jgi:hypothetical protein